MKEWSCVYIGKSSPIIYGQTGKGKKVNGSQVFWQFFVHGGATYIVSRQDLYFGPPDLPQP
jgi:hypothetical protein